MQRSGQVGPKPQNPRVPSWGAKPDTYLEQARIHTFRVRERGCVFPKCLFGLVSETYTREVWAATQLHTYGEKGEGNHS